MLDKLCASYTDPRLAKVYDPLNYYADSEARSFFIDLAGTEPRSILDVGCGTGVLACELSKLGHRVTGVDPAAAMLQIARERPGADDVTWMESEAASLALTARFDLILMTGHVFQVFLADEHIHAVLSNLQRHLVPNGQLAFASRNPLVREWSEWTPDQTLEQVEVPGIGEVIVHYDILSAVDQFVTFETHFTFPSQEKVITTSKLRFMPQEKIARSLSAAGFTNLQWYGDYKGGRLSPMSPEIIAIAS